jgi:hypothetical protein
MPEVGDPCGGTDAIEKSSTGEFLVCRNGTWQLVGDAPPVEEGAPPTRSRRDSAASGSPSDSATTTDDAGSDNEHPDGDVVG